MKLVRSFLFIAFAALCLGIAFPAFSAPLALDEGETQHLIFMREEEKLARDVYLTLAGMYPAWSVFESIATKSEQTHTDTVRDMLEKFNIADPNPDANNLPEMIGIFTGEDYGWYFTDKFNALVSRAEISVTEALLVGGFIEELDMLDIVDCPKVIWENSDVIDEGECGLDYTSKKPLTSMYVHLLEGSKDHLRAYVKNVETIIGEGNYEAQVLPQDVVDDILGR